MVGDTLLVLARHIVPTALIAFLSDAGCDTLWFLLGTSLGSARRDRSMSHRVHFTSWRCAFAWPARRSNVDWCDTTGSISSRPPGSSQNRSGIMRPRSGCIFGNGNLLGIDLDLARMFRLILPISFGLDYAVNLCSSSTCCPRHPWNISSGCITTSHDRVLDPDDLILDYIAVSTKTDPTPTNREYLGSWRTHLETILSLPATGSLHHDLRTPRMTRSINRVCLP